MIPGAAILVSGGVLLAGLVTLAVIDIRTLRLPDWLTLPLIPAGWLSAWWLGDPVLWHIAGAAIGYAAFVALELGYKAYRGRDGLGRGDAKLLAVGGAWCGALLLPVIVLIASAAGLVWALSMALLARRAVNAQSTLAFGPFLAAGIALAWLLLRTGLWV
ncbi:MAG: prepilin peptidase [Caulobacterales bacterium]|uniref:prepilin peptidase n=1 Tax=Glycocaulis sp. TaxID=1969725 RepID=UPI003F9FF9B9